ncbi:MAG: SOS response-associated peptidase [Gammaproteobacteria bacterium TMED92]|nr:MAG: SOS response-associated peptidase [Gammaproteobacteria bacterium TMED92]
MCGRLHIRAADVTQMLLEFLDLIHEGPDNLNAAPTEEIFVLVSDAAGAVSLQPMRWWLTPSWAKAPSTRYSMFNAKSETAATLPSFREPYKHRRCVVPVSGFYEWARRQGHKQAYFLRSAENAGLLLAGLWDRWQGQDQAGQTQRFDSFTILTGAASDSMQALHHRQPVILNNQQAQRWLDPSVATTELESYFAPQLSVSISALPVSSWVNNARNKDARCEQGLGEALLLS